MSVTVRLETVPSLRREPLDDLSSGFRCHLRDRLLIAEQGGCDRKHDDNDDEQPDEGEQNRPFAAAKLVRYAVRHACADPHSDVGDGSRT